MEEQKDINVGDFVILKNDTEKRVFKVRTKLDSGILDLRLKDGHRQSHHSSQVELFEDVELTDYYEAGGFIDG